MKTYTEQVNTGTEWKDAVEFRHFSVFPSLMRCDHKRQPGWAAQRNRCRYWTAPAFRGETSKCGKMIGLRRVRLWVKRLPKFLDEMVSLLEECGSVPSERRRRTAQAHGRTCSVFPAAELLMKQVRKGPRFKLTCSMHTLQHLLFFSICYL